MNAKSLLQNLKQDAGFALRTMGRNPAFSAGVVLTIALGIGANTAMFTVIRAVLLKPLEYREPDRVVIVADGATQVRFDEFKESAKSYDAIGAYANGLEEIALTGAGEPVVVKGARVSANFLDILGVTPLRGRAFYAKEDRKGVEPVAMISAALWRDRFASDPAIVGKTVILGGASHTVVGVLPPGFQFPIAGADFWVTQPAEWSVLPEMNRRISPILGLFGRLKTGVSLEQANAELTVLNQQYAEAHPDMLHAKPDSPQTVQPLKEELVSDIRPKLWLLLGAVGFVLLIVCGNVASLLLARATSRGREFAVRAAIGAGRGRIVQQLLAESTLLAGLGGVIGIALAAGSLNGIRALTYIDLPRANEIRMDWIVVALSLGLTVITGVVFGLAPALVASKPNLAAMLRGSGEGASTDARPRRWFGSRDLLVAGQIALSVVLLIGASLLIKSLARLYRVDMGFQSKGLLTMNLSLSPTRYNTIGKRAGFYEHVVRQIQSLPGVRAAAVATTMPMDGFFGTTAQLAGRAPVPDNQRPIVIIESITPEYFRTMGIAMRRGRTFSSGDREGTVETAIVNESFARLFWPGDAAGTNVIGQRILTGGNSHPIEIVGIAADVRATGRDQNPRAAVYFPCAQKPPQGAMIAVRTSGEPLTFANAVRGQVLAVDPEQPVSQVSTMENIVNDSEGQLHLMMNLLGGFALAAALLAMLGLYAVISHSVVQRVKEIGIRRALGAQRGDILSLLVRRGLILSVTGSVLGIGGAIAVTRLLQDLLFQVSPTDPATLAAVAVVFVMVAVAASLIPARRAARIDPQEVLRMG